jgi:hypothetical protein
MNQGGMRPRSLSVGILQTKLLVFELGVAAKAHLIGFKHDESILQFGSVFFSKPDYGACERGTRISRKPYQDYTSRICMADENQPSEVLVFGKQNTILRMGKLDDVAVV